MSYTGDMDDRYVKQMAMTICGFAKTKKKCGMILKEFSEDMNSSEALSFIHEIIAYDFFMDLRGKLDDFIDAIPELSHALRRLIKSNFNMNSKGEIIESDEDEDGNLKDFIVDNDEEEDEVEDEDNTGINGKFFDEETDNDEDNQRRTKKRVIIVDDDDDDDDGQENDEPDYDKNEQSQIQELNRIAAEKRRKKKKMNRIPTAD